MNHVWYRWLDRNVKFGTHAQKVVKKVVADFCMSPAFVVTFLAGKGIGHFVKRILGIALLERKPIREPIDEFRKKFVDYVKVVSLDLGVINLFLARSLSLATNSSVELLVRATRTSSVLRVLWSIGLQQLHDRYQTPRRCQRCESFFFE